MSLFIYSSLTHFKLQLIVYIALLCGSYYCKPPFFSSSLSSHIPVRSLYSAYFISRAYMLSSIYVILVKLPFQLRKVTFLFVSVVLMCYLKNFIL